MHRSMRGRGSRPLFEKREREERERVGIFTTATYRCYFCMCADFWSDVAQLQMLAPAMFAQSASLVCQYHKEERSIKIFNV